MLTLTWDRDEMYEGRSLDHLDAVAMFSSHVTFANPH